MYKAKTKIGQFEVKGEYVKSGDNHYIIMDQGVLKTSYIIEEKTLKKVE